METLLHDLRLSIRMLLKQPGFTMVAAFALALGIGANLTIFSLVDALFYKPLPVPIPDRLVYVESTRNGTYEWGFAYPAYTYYRDHSTTCSTLVAHYSTAPLNIVTEGNSWEANGAVVSGNYFSTLDVHPLLGRFFLPEEDAVPDRNPVVVISCRMWQNRFGSDPSILEKEIRVNSVIFKIIGVTPANFQGVEVGYPNDVWIPTMMLRVGYRWCDGFHNLDCRPLSIIGRLAPGHNLLEAEAELAILSGQLVSANPEMKNCSVKLMPAVGVRTADREGFTYQIRLLIAVASLLLLIACANVAGLLLVRSATRRKEIAVRLALGANRFKLIRQLLTESLLLALLGGAFGLLLSLWGKDLLMHFFTLSTSNQPRQFDLSLNPRVLAFSLTLSILTGLLSGLVPALQSPRQDIAHTLKDDGRSQSPHHSRLRGALVIGQVALSFALLIGAGLLFRSATNVQKGLNFDPTHVAVMRLRPRLTKYNPEKAQAYTREVLRRLEAFPEVESVSLAKGIGLAWLDSDQLHVRLPEQNSVRLEDQLKVASHEIAPRFLETLKIPLLQGREFNDQDRTGSPRVTIINQTLARKMWPDGSPLGRVLIINDLPFQVVGVFKDARLRNALEAPLPFLYIPYWQNNFEPQIDSRLVVRVAGDPQSLLPLLRREITMVDSDVPISEDMTMSQQVSGRYMPVIMASGVVACASGLALFLSMIGLYGVLAFTVTKRTREIGIRMALGAQVPDVLKMIIGHGMAMISIGLLIGLVAAFALTRLMSSLLYGISTTDPATFIVIALFISVVALLASYLPARRAAKVDPMIALRYE